MDSTTFEDRLASEKPAEPCKTCAALAALTEEQRGALEAAGLTNAGLSRVLLVSADALARHQGRGHQGAARTRS